MSSVEKMKKDHHAVINEIRELDQPQLLKVQTRVNDLYQKLKKMKIQPSDFPMRKRKLLAVRNQIDGRLKQLNTKKPGSGTKTNFGSKIYEFLQDYEAQYLGLQIRKYEGNHQKSGHIKYSQAFQIRQTLYPSELQKLPFTIMGSEESNSLKKIKPQIYGLLEGGTGIILLGCQTYEEDFQLKIRHVTQKYLQKEERKWLQTIVRTCLKDFEDKMVLIEYVPVYQKFANSQNSQKPVALLPRISLMQVDEHSEDKPKSEFHICDSKKKEEKEDKNKSSLQNEAKTMTQQGQSKQLDRQKTKGSPKKVYLQDLDKKIFFEKRFS